jgi:hypothetical protein
MKTPKKTGKASAAKKPSDKVIPKEGAQEDAKPVSRFSDDEEDDYDLPLEEIEGFDDYSGGGSYDDDDDY